MLIGRFQGTFTLILIRLEIYLNCNQVSKKTIWIIISLMSIALIGLIGFQLFWINNVVKLSNQRFESDVRESLQNVVTKLERNEMLYLVSKNELWEYDTLMTKKWITATSGNVFWEEKGNEEEFIHSDSSGKRIMKFKTNQNNVEFVYHEKVKVDSSNGEIQVIQESEMRGISPRAEMTVDVNKLENKTAQMEVVVREILEMEAGETHRVHPQVLDSLLHEEFTGKGIHITYDFGVFNEDENNFVFVQAGNKEHLQNSQLKANLFPNDLLGNVNYLLVNFPDQNSFLLKQISTTLITSVLLIGIIIFCFVYAINTILRQKKLSDVKNDFINNMTHEFKTPLATVSLATQALEENDIRNNPKTYNRYLKVIKEETERLGDQVERVLQVATFDKGQFELKIESVDVIQLLNEVIDSFRIQIENANGNITKEYDRESFQAELDVTHFQNAIRNLLDNAIKYSPEAPVITMKFTGSEDSFQISVKDSGIGISKEQLKRIFERFYRIPKGNLHDVKGFGLGLHYVKNVVIAHGGDIDARSSPGAGSTFSIKLPIHG